MENQKSSALKKVLGIVGSLILGVNFGLISPFLPVYLILDLTVLADPKSYGEALNAWALGGQGLFSAILAGVLMYIHTYRRKREHESVNPYLAAFAWSFAVSALVVSVMLFIYSGNDKYRLR